MTQAGSADAAVRVRLDLSFDGTDFAGWARQPGQRTVQQVLEEALTQVLRHPVRVLAAGRTDAGVHARAQVAHADLDAAAWARGQRSLVRALRGVLPGDVRVRSVRAAPPGFDARFSALWRRYEYRLTDAGWGVDPLRRHDTVAWGRPVDAAAMAAAAAQLLGVHDFVAFCRRRDGATTVRGLQRLDVERRGEIVVVTAVADAFCHSMVRSLVGALLAVGDGRQALSWPASLLTSAVRADAVVVAPAHGLTLVDIGYPDDGQLGVRAAQTRRLRHR